jgi:hypothetical protein
VRDARRQRGSTSAGNGGPYPGLIGGVRIAGAV